MAGRSMHRPEQPCNGNQQNQQEAANACSHGSAFMVFVH
jgi:hypothetical protein